MSVIDHIEMKIAALEQLVKTMNTDEARIARIKGRITPYDYVMQQTFGTVDSGTEGARIRIEVSEDGPFIMTHYPQFVWKPSAPTTTPSYGMWRAITSFPYPAQATFEADADIENNYVNLSWEMLDTKSGRRFQSTGRRPINATQVANTFERVPALLSSFPALEARLPKPCYFESGTTILITPFYEDISFDDTTGGVPPTEGTLRVCLPGYRIT